MEKTFIGVRDVDKDTFNKFRAKAIRDKQKLGEALTKAMEKFVSEDKPKKIPDIKNLYKIKGLIKTKEKVRWSEEVDEILYN